jgi:hypothetical protein
MRSVSSVSSRRLLLLAPSRRAVPDSFTQVHTDSREHEELLAQTQSFRGRVYLEDGAIKRWQLIDGKHRVEIDEGSWHVLVLDSSGKVCGCARIKPYPAGTAFAELGAARSALALSRDWGHMLRGAVETEMALARQMRIATTEWGGWALDDEIRGSAEALRMTLAAYALTQSLGGGIALSCVTRRHGSASILRRMGGRPLECCGIELPPYYDPQYECEMEILRFCSWSPNPRYSVWIEEIKSSLRATRVVANGAGEPAWVEPRWVGAGRSRAISASGSQSGSRSAAAGG